VVHPKEVNFFSYEKDWQKGLAWYASLFEEGAETPLVGEASVSYTSPDHCAEAAGRMSDAVPQARLIYCIRNPVDRIRSHYRHEVQRTRERRSLIEALREPGNSYVGNSLYFSCLRPYIDRFPREQICVVRFDDLVGSAPEGWLSVLRYLGLSERPCPGTAHNVSSQSAQWTRRMLWLRRKGILHLRRVATLPGPVRAIGRRVLGRRPAAYQRQLKESFATIPDTILDPVWEDLGRLEAWLGVERPLWAATTPATS
jgi:sulfotransferase family protein